MMKMTTASGTLLDLANPLPEAINIHDIAVALSRIPRFNGHTRVFYSVAQHSLACAQFASQRGFSAHRQLALLMHDAHEAYLGDLTSPFVDAVCRAGFPRFDDVVHAMKHSLDVTIAEALGLSACNWRMDGDVKAIDEFMLHAEAHELLGDRAKTWRYDGPAWLREDLRTYRLDIDAFPRRDAEHLFLRAYRSLRKATEKGREDCDAGD